MKTEVIQVHPEFPDLNVISEAAKILKKGGLVVFPTETVYGIAADYFNQKAIDRLGEVKKRPSDKPFSILIPRLDYIARHTADTSTALYKLLHEFWPGPLTVVVPSREEGKTIGVRMPDNMIALRLLYESGLTLAAPSANFDGNDPPATCGDALRDLDGLVEMALDGGEARTGQASTVVDMTKGRPVILREGGISLEEINRVLARKTVLFICTGNSCRSVMAEYLLKDMVKHRDDIEVFSAGTSVFLHSTASADTIGLLKEEGIDATNHFSRPMDTALLRKADLILAMTHAHRAQVLAYCPEVEKRVYLLKEFIQTPEESITGLDIPDPIGSSLATYRDCFRVIKEAVAKLEKIV